jgi:hypothetical protein
MTNAPASRKPSIKEPPPTKPPQSLPGPDGNSEPDPSVDGEPDKRSNDIDPKSSVQEPGEPIVNDDEDIDDGDGRP